MWEGFVAEGAGPKVPQCFNRVGMAVSFPVPGTIKRPRSGVKHRYHISDTYIQRAIRKAVKQSSITKKASCHTLQHSFATHLLDDGYDIRTVQELLEHKNVKTTMIYTHILNRKGKGVKNSLDS